MVLGNGSISCISCGILRRIRKCSHMTQGEEEVVEYTMVVTQDSL